ncbi:hypothetical protein SETIT_8G073900v2 [Setaria italica]|uniref:Uncharacterized protein n=1 Tax=Setaria italica TaxID=4555 RepID=A0A368S558_SETIT|nr:hypothetical protein SETIT_8G073900v2 [Setaria italica]
MPSKSLNLLIGSHENQITTTLVKPLAGQRRPARGAAAVLLGARGRGWLDLSDARVPGAQSREPPLFGNQHYCPLVLCSGLGRQRLGGWCSGAQRKEEMEGTGVAMGKGIEEDGNQQRGLPGRQDGEKKMELTCTSTYSLHATQAF